MCLLVLFLECPLFLLHAYPCIFFYDHLIFPPPLVYVSQGPQFPPLAYLLLAGRSKFSSPITSIPSLFSPPAVTMTLSQRIAV